MDFLTANAAVQQALFHILFQIKVNKYNVKANNQNH